MSIASNLTSGAWWKAAAIRAVRTAIVIAIPYIPGSATNQIPWTTLASAAGLGLLVSLLTSLAGLPEVSGTPQPWWYATLSRVVKTVAAAVVASIGSAVLIQDVNWALIGGTIATSAFSSLLLSILTTLPEAPDPVHITASTELGQVPVITSLPPAQPINSNVVGTGKS